MITLILTDDKTMTILMALELAKSREPTAAAEAMYTDVYEDIISQMISQSVELPPVDPEYQRVPNIIHTGASQHG